MQVADPHHTPSTQAVSDEQAARAASDDAARPNTTPSHPTSKLGKSSSLKKLETESVRVPKRRGKFGARSIIRLEKELKLLNAI